MQKKYMRSIIAGSILFTALFTSCKKDNKDMGPSGPVSIESFTPSEGGATTEILINGKNFTADTSKISVLINGKRLKIIGANDHQIMAVLPKKTGTGPVTVTVNGQSATSTQSFAYKFTHTVSTLAGNGQPGYVNGNGTDAQFHLFDAGNYWYRNQGIVVDKSLNVYVAEPINHCIRKIDSLGNVTLFAGSPGVGGDADGKGANAQFQWPWAMGLDANDNIYLIDVWSWAIRKITPDGTVTTIGWTKEEPWSMTVNKTTGDLYYMNPWACSVFQVKADGSQTKVIDYAGLWASGIACDKDGNLYVVSDGDQVVRKFTAGTWTPSVIAGTLGSAGVVNGIGTAAKFSYPWGLSIDDAGNLYVGGNDGNSGANADHAIRMITAGTWEVSTPAGGTIAGFTNGVGAAATFAGPVNSAVDKNGTIYVLDKRNNAIRKIIAE